MGWLPLHNYVPTDDFWGMAAGPTPPNSCFGASDDCNARQHPSESQPPPSRQACIASTHPTTGAKLRPHVASLCRQRLRAESAWESDLFRVRYRGCLQCQGYNNHQRRVIDMAFQQTSAAAPHLLQRLGATCAVGCHSDAACMMVGEGVPVLGCHWAGGVMSHLANVNEARRHLIGSTGQRRRIPRWCAHEPTFASALRRPLPNPIAGALR